MSLEWVEVEAGTLVNSAVTLSIHALARDTGSLAVGTGAALSHFGADGIEDYEDFRDEYPLVYRAINETFDVAAPSRGHRAARGDGVMFVLRQESYLSDMNGAFTACDAFKVFTAAFFRKRQELDLAADTLEHILFVETHDLLDEELRLLQAYMAMFRGEP